MAVSQTIKKCFNIALAQMSVCSNKSENIQKAVNIIKEARAKNTDLVILPECFNCPYGTKYAECIPDGETSQALSKVARENKIFVIGGSIPERDGDKIFNTCVVWDQNGNLVCKHRKIHLFDIDIPGGVTFKESDVLSAGDKFTIFDAGVCKIGLGICYDLRFEEMAIIYRKMGVNMIVYPGAFNMTTGPLHWELLIRGRAVDNQIFVAGVCCAQDKSADYIAWGHSMIVDPWGKVLKKAEFEDTVLYETIGICDAIKTMIPISKQRRSDLYDTINKSRL